MISLLPKVSIIVPVYNGGNFLPKLLDALLKQTYPRELYEIIMVDNNSADNSVDIIRQYPVILKEEKSIQSSYAARNTGIQCASGDILAFTDTDCAPSLSWLHEGVSALLASSSGLAGGPIEFFFSPQKTTAEMFDSLMNLDYFYWRSHGIWATANLFVRREVFLRVGMFPTKYSGADMQWTALATREGFSIAFAPEAVVYHPARQWKELLKKSYRVGCGVPMVWIARGYSRWGAAKKTILLFFPLRISTLLNKIQVRGFPEMKKRLLRLWLFGYVCKLIRGLGCLHGFVCLLVDRIKKNDSLQIPRLKSKLNVLVGILKYPPDFTGAGQRIHHIYYRLQEKGVGNVHVITTSPDSFHFKKERLDGVEVNYLGRNRFLEPQKTFTGRLGKSAYILGTCFRTYMLYRKISRSVDVVHTVDSSWFSTWVAVLAYISRKPLIKEIVLLGSDDPFSLKSKKILKSLFLFPFHYARQVVVISEPLKRACLAAGIPDHKIWCRHNPVYISGRDGMDDQRPSVLNGEQKNILWVGKISPRKNIDFLVKSAFYLQGPALLTFIGPPGENREYFKRLISLAEMATIMTERRICFRFIDHALHQDELGRYYSQSDLFWFSSLKEGMGNVVAESLVHGTPVVTLPVDGIMHTLITHPEDGEIVDTHDPEQFAQAVNRWLLRGDIDRAAISRRARNIFDPGAVENGYLLRLQECARSTP